MYLRSNDGIEPIPDRISTLKKQDFISEGCHASDDRTAYVRHPMFLKAISGTYMNPTKNTARKPILLLFVSCKLLIMGKGRM